MKEQKDGLSILKATFLVSIYAIVLPCIAIILLEIFNTIFKYKISMYHPTFYALSNITSIFIILLWLIKKHQLKVNRLKWSMLQPIYIIALTLTIVGLSILLSELNNFIMKVFPMGKYDIRVFNDLLGGKISIVGSVIITVLIAPIIEEILLRGIILNGLLARYSKTTSILVSSLLFGAMHLNIWQSPGAFIIGIVFAWWFIKTGSIVPCIIGHMINNTLPYIALSLSIKGYSTDFTKVQHQPLWFNFLGLILLAIGLFITFKLFKKQKTQVENYDIEVNFSNNKKDQPTESIIFDSGQTEYKPRSLKLGLMSFILSLVMFILLIILISIALMTTKPNQPTIDSLSLITGLISLLEVLLCICGISLGIISLFKENNGRKFAIIGLLIHSLFLILIIGVILFNPNNPKTHNTINNSVSEIKSEK